MLGIGIVRWGNLDDVSGDEVDALETTDDGAQFTGGPASCFGGAGGGCDYFFLLAMFVFCILFGEGYDWKWGRKSLQAGSRVSMSRER